MILALSHAAPLMDEILRSGFPGLRELDGRPLRAQLDGYLRRVVERDFPQLGQPVRKPDALRRRMTAYAAATATTTSFKRIRDASTSGEDTKPARSTVQPLGSAASADVSHALSS